MTQHLRAPTLRLLKEECKSTTETYGEADRSNVVR